MGFDLCTSCPSVHLKGLFFPGLFNVPYLMQCLQWLRSFDLLIINSANQEGWLH